MQEYIDSRARKYLCSLSSFDDPGRSENTGAFNRQIIVDQNNHSEHTDAQTRKMQTFRSTCFLSALIRVSSIHIMTTLATVVDIISQLAYLYLGLS